LWLRLRLPLRLCLQLRRWFYVRLRALRSRHHKGKRHRDDAAEGGDPQPFAHCHLFSLDRRADGALDRRINHPTTFLGCVRMRRGRWEFAPTWELAPT